MKASGRKSEWAASVCAYSLSATHWACRRRRYLNGADAIGRRLQTRTQSFAIIGVAANSAYDALAEPPQPAVYFSYRDRPASQGEIHLRTRSGNESALTSDARAVLRDLDPMLPLYDVRTFSQHIERNLYLRRVPARMFVVLGPLLLGLATIGIYAVVSYAVARRTREIGVRLAFGAISGRVVLHIIRENLAAITGAPRLDGYSRSCFPFTS